MGLFGLKDVKAVLTRVALLAADLSLVTTSFLLAYYLRFHFFPIVETFPVNKGIPAVDLYLQILPIVLIIWGAVLYWQDAYKRLNLNALDEFLLLGRSAFAGTILSMSAMFAFRDQAYSRLVVGIAGIISFFSIF